MKKPFLAIMAATLFAFSLTACNDQGDAERVAELEAELQQKTEELRKAREWYDRQLTEFTASVRSRHAKETRELEATMEEERTSFTRTIHSLQARLAAKERVPVQPSAPPIATPAPDPPAAPPTPRITTRSVTTPEAAFPVAVSDLSGEQVVVGSHISTRIVETDEEYRDAFGEMKRRKRPETYEVPDYSYRASATLNNLADTPTTVFLRCGPGEQTVTLAPGAEQRVSLDSTPGAPLVMRANGRTKSMNVTYP